MLKYQLPLTGYGPLPASFIPLVPISIEDVDVRVCDIQGGIIDEVGGESN